MYDVAVNAMPANGLTPEGARPSTDTMKLVNTLRLKQDGHPFPDDNFKCIFLNENIWILIKISLMLLPVVKLTNSSTGLDNGLATNHYLNQWWLGNWHIYTSLGPNELKEGLFCIDEQ